jgi:hypothetical protein
MPRNYFDQRARHRRLTIYERTQIMPSLAALLAKPKTISPRYIIDPVAFFIALIGGPLVFTLATFWILFIPVFALVYGVVPYLVLGIPVLLFYLSRNPARPSSLAGIGLLTLFSAAALLALGAVLTNNQNGLGFIAFYVGFGIFFAPAWAASFGWVYGKLCRDFYAHPVPANL